MVIPGASAPVDKLRGVRRLSRDDFGGYLGPLRVIQRPGTLLIQVSLAKYLNGENATTLTRESFCDALGMLEEESGLDLCRAPVYRAEVAASIPVQEPVRNYLSTWGPVPRHKKHVWGECETVTYENGRRSFTGYDKAAEMDPAPLPGRLAGQHVVRL